MAEVTLQAGMSLCVDVDPVTLSAYQECVGRALCSGRPAGGGCLRDDLNTQQKPVDCVDAAQADAFCKAQKKRLPTRQEIEATPFRGEGTLIRWGAGSEWTSSSGRQGMFTTMRYNPINRTFFNQAEAPASTQNPSLGFRCVR